VDSFTGAAGQSPQYWLDSGMQASAKRGGRRVGKGGAAAACQMSSATVGVERKAARSTTRAAKNSADLASGAALGAATEGVPVAVKRPEAAEAERATHLRHTGQRQGGQFQHTLIRAPAV
jgi:hypothetical protein